MYKPFVVFAALLAVALAEPEAKAQLPAAYGVNPYHHAAVAPFNYGLHPEAKAQLPAAYGVNPYHHAAVAPFNYGLHPEAKAHLPAAYGVNPYHHAAVAPFNYGLHREAKTSAAYGVNPYHHSVAPFNYGLHPHGDAFKHYSMFHDVSKYGAYPYNKFGAYQQPTPYHGAHSSNYGIHGDPFHHEAYTAGYPYHAGAFQHPYNSAVVQPKY